MAKKMNKLWLIPLILLIPTVVRANQITPQFTQGSMQATTVTTQTVTEVIDQEIFGGNYSSWTGTNMKVNSGSYTGGDAVFGIVDEDEPWQLETVVRPAGVVEQIDIDRSIQTNSTTTSLSVFSQ